MSFESDLYAVLNAVAPNAVYPDFAAVGTPRPYCTYQMIGGPVINPLGGEASGLRSVEYQINTWADTRMQAKSLIRAIETALRAATTFDAQPMAEPVDDFDAEIPVYGSLQSFLCHYRE